MDEVNGEFNIVNFEEEEAQIHEWEIGLPNVNDIPPLNKGLVPLELLTAFNISPEPYLTDGDVTRASEDTLSSIRGQSNNLQPLYQIADNINGGDDEEDGDGVIDDESGRKPRRNESPEDADSATPADGVGGGEKAGKRARLVWTPQLHKRFVDVVGHLGIKNAVPKTIMELMNVEGLTRENVASHLQKYRLYLKRMGGGSGCTSGGSSESPSGSAPEVGPGMMVPMPVQVPMMMGMGMGMGGYNGYHNQYNNGMMMMMQSGGGSYNMFGGGSGLGYHHHDHDHTNNLNQGSGGQMMN